MVFEEFSDFKLDGNEDVFIDEYITAYSKYLITAYFSYAKKEMANLAKRGHTRSLAKYIAKVKPEEWDEELKNKAYEIKNRNGAKTPQEWEVVAAIEFHKPLIENDDADIKTVSDLRKKLCVLGQEYYEAEGLYKKGKVEAQYVHNISKKVKELVMLYQKQPYLQTLKKVQEGYYAAAVENYKFLDFVGFLEFTNSPDDIYLEFDNFMQYGNGVIYTREDFAKVITETFEKRKKNEDVTYCEFFTYGFVKTLFGKSKSSQNYGVEVLNYISQLPIKKPDEKVEITIDKKKIKEKAD